MDRYLQLSHELDKKQFLERIIFEIEYSFFKWGISSVDKKMLFNDTSNNGVFSKKEYDILLNKAIKIIGKNNNIKVRLDKDNIVWVNALNKN